MLGRAYEEGLTRAQLAPEGRQAVAPGSGLRSNCSLHGWLMTWHYRLHSATQHLLLENSLAARVCRYLQATSQKECPVLIADCADVVL